jgi:hypothetical protein
MKHSLILFASLLGSSALLGQPSNHAPADSLLGQASFSSQVEVTTPSASSLSLVEGVAVDPTSGKLFVADSGNHRILRFASTEAPAPPR